MTYHLDYNKWFLLNKDSIIELYYILINTNIRLFSPTKCSLNKFAIFCYKFSSKESYRYL